MKKRSLLKALLAAVFVCATVAMGADSPAVKGNPKSKVYHKATCRYYASKSSTVVFKTEIEAQKAGYKACKQCGKTKAAKKAKKPVEKKPAASNKK